MLGNCWANAKGGAQTGSGGTSPDIVLPMVFLSLTVAALGLTVAVLVCASLLASPPPALLRTNFRGKEIPVVGGLVIVSGLLAGEVALAVTYLLEKGGRSAVTFASRDHWGLLVPALGFFAAGLPDDLP